MKETNEELRADYDFSGGTRGKYKHFAGQTRTVKIHHPDGSVTVEMIEPAIQLDPEVRKYFPNSEAVNKALRGLIELIPKED
jgi:hypothetical protein